MSLPAPNLDDRRFQDIVDEAKRRITRYCPEWTDHNVSDPGVALIELFAWMTEMILYRVNQVPDRLYVKFLEPVGIELFSAAPARTDLLFTLAAPSPEPIRIAAGTQVGTERGQGEEQIVFMTDEELHLVQPALSACLSRGGGRYEDHSESLRLGGSMVPCFPTLRPGDALYLGFAGSLAGNLIRMHVNVGGVDAPGIDPLFSSSPHPSLLWALELVAWSPDHFAQAVYLLARLAEVDPGGRLINRPHASLATIFCPWHPETGAPNARRRSASAAR